MVREVGKRITYGMRNATSKKYTIKLEALSDYCHELLAFGQGKLGGRIEKRLVLGREQG